MEFTEKQLQHQRELSENREKAQAEKKRNHRLIVHGAIAESFIPGSEEMDQDEFEQALASLLSPSGRRNSPVEESEEQSAKPSVLKELRW